MYTILNKKYVFGVGMVKLCQHQNSTVKVTATTEHGDTFEALWTQEEQAYEMYTEVVDVSTMVERFQLDWLN